MITLVHGPLGLASDLTIEGLGAGLLTVRGTHATRVFDVADFSGTVSSVTIRGLTISGGATAFSSAAASSTGKT